MSTPQLAPTATSNHRHFHSIGIAAVLVLSILPTSTTAAPNAARTPEPRITFLDQPTAQQREIITWAADRYRAAGLQLPDLTISFPALCSGKKALYHVGRRSIDFCRMNRRTVLHEFAHAWDDTSGAVDRAAFLELRRLTVWWGGTDMPSGEQGAEQLAQIVAWGLMDVDTRGVPAFPDNSVGELTKAFVMITGGVKPRQPESTATSQS